MPIYLHSVLSNSKEWNIDDNSHAYNINILTYIFSLKKKMFKIQLTNAEKINKEGRLQARAARKSKQTYK